MSILQQALARVRSASPEAREFVVPAVSRGSARYTVSVNSVPFQFDVDTSEAGWKKILVRDGVAYVARDAYPHEVERYLAGLPKWTAVASGRIAAGTWVCVPFNPGDAAQRGWPSSEPRVVALVDESISTGDIVNIYGKGPTLLYGSQSLRHAPAWYSSSIAFEIGEQLAQEHEARETKQTQREKVEGALAFVGAELDDIIESGESYLVSWTYLNRRHTARIDANLEVVSSGICLSGKDDNYNLSSVVLVVNEAHQRGVIYRTRT